MKISVRSYLTSGLAVIGASAIALTPALSPPDPTRAEQSAVALTSQGQQIPGLLGRQVDFHVDLAVEFVVTGAQLTGRLIAIPGTFLEDLSSGTPLSAAAREALLEFADVELDAGGKLVGYAVRYGNFQINFLRDLISQPPPVLSAGPAGQQATPNVSATPRQFPDLLREQVEFHVDFVVDFVVTGAQLTGRLIAIPGSFLEDVQSGTPLPEAAGQALQDFADVELDAGAELVDFGARYANFQIDFVRDLVSEPPPGIAAADAGERVFERAGDDARGSAAPAGDLAAAPNIRATSGESTAKATPLAVTDTLTSSPSDNGTIDTADEPAGNTPTAKDDNPRRVGLRDKLTAGTVRAQGEVRSTGATAKADEAGPKARGERGVVRQTLRSISRAFDDDRQQDERVQQKGDGASDNAASDGESGTKQD